MRIIVYFVLFIVSTICSAQEIVSRLIDLGFENIAICESGDTLYMAIEDYSYRGTFRGAGIAIREVEKCFPGKTNVELVIKERNIDKVAIHGVKDSGRWKVMVDYDSKLINERLQSGVDKCGRGDMPNVNSSYGRFDVTFYPVVSLDNHLLYKLFSYGIKIAPALETSMWKGNHLIFQPLFPIADNGEVGNDESNRVNRRIQIGSLNIQQDIFRSAGIWGRVSAGFFHYNYVGLNADVGCHINKYFDFSVVASVTKWQELNKWSLHVGRDNNVSALASLSYYEPLSSVEAKLTAGRFIYGDYGVRGECICHFGEYCIGGFVMVSDFEHNAGFNFSIPLAGKRQKRMGRFTIKMPQSFDWEYNMVNNFDWADKKCGRELIVDGGKDRAAHYWQARYIQTYLQKFLDGVVD